MTKTLPLLAVWVSALFIFSSCGESETPLFNMEYELNFTIPPGLNTIETHVFTIQDVPARFEEFASVNSVPTSAVSRVLPNRADLLALFQNVNYSFVERVSIWIKSNDNPLIERELFFLDFVEFNEDNDIMMFSSISDVKDILVEGDFDIEVRLILRNFSPLEIDSRLIFSLTALEE